MARGKKDFDVGLETKAKVCPLAKAEEEEIIAKHHGRVVIRRSIRPISDMYRYSITLLRSYLVATRDYR